MTREEEHQSAIEWIEGLRDRWNDKDNVKYCNMAIKALEQTEPEKCGDCISREAAIQAVTHFDDPLKRLYELPSAEPERKPGKWIPVYDDNGRCSDFRCSACNGADEYGSKFCPNCGAKMSEADIAYEATPHGYWIHDEDWECSVCHSHFPEPKFMANDYGTPLYNYCPICGADLTGV